MSAGMIIGGVAGAAIGFSMGGPVGAYYGATIGMAIGGAYDYSQSGGSDLGKPQLQDLVLPTASEGLPIPDALGTTKVTGNFLWYGKPRVEEVRETPDGAKGGDSKVTTGYEYYLSFALGILQGPVDTLYTIFADDKIEWSGVLSRPESGGMATVTTDNGTIYFYFGTDDQAVNSDMAAELEMVLELEPGSCPAYRHLCYAYFADYMIGSYNRCPAIRFLIRKVPEQSFNQYHAYHHNYNPAHALKYIICDMVGLPDSYINNTSFSNSADTLYADGLVLCARSVSILFDKSAPAIRYIESLMLHINFIVRYNSQAELEMILIRKDQAIENLPVITADDLLSDPDVNRKDIIDTHNAVKIEYSHRY